jgi:hypothetical protein
MPRSWCAWVCATAKPLTRRICAQDAHEVPSGGDWSVTRQAAVFVENANSVSLVDLSMSNLGGNGVFLSRTVQDTDIGRVSFQNLGSTAILIVGDPRFDVPAPWDYTATDTFPQRIRVFNCLAHDIGQTFKQSAGVFVAIAKSVDVDSSLFYNGPRGGVEFNDGFGGGNVLRRSVIFNMVLETSDHGPFNVWDRQKWLEPPGKKANRVEQNLILGNRQGAKGIDLDDGATGYVNTGNVIVWGYHKFKGKQVNASNNLVLMPLEQGCVFITSASSIPSAFVWDNNTCVTAGLGPYGWVDFPATLPGLCVRTNFVARNNRIYMDGVPQNFATCGSPNNLAGWRSMQQDAGLAFSPKLPSVPALLDMMKKAMSGWWA